MSKSVTSYFQNSAIFMGALKHGQEEARAPPPLWKCCKVFLCISSYGKTLSRRIIYALFSQPVIGFCRLRPQRPRPQPGLHPWIPLGDFGPQTSNLPTPEKNPAGAHGYTACMPSILTALRGMQTWSSDENSVRLSVCLSNALIVTKRNKDLSDFYAIRTIIIDS